MVGVSSRKGFQMSNTFTTLEALNAFTRSLPFTGFFLSSVDLLDGVFRGSVTVMLPSTHPLSVKVGLAVVAANGSHGQVDAAFFAHGVDAVEAAAVEAAFASMSPAVFAAFIAHVESEFDWPGIEGGPGAVEYVDWCAAQGFGSTVDGAAGRYVEALGETLLGD